MRRHPTSESRALLVRTALWMGPVALLSQLTLNLWFFESHGRSFEWFPLGPAEFEQALQGDEELFLVLGYFLWAFGVSYLVAARETIRECRVPPLRRFAPIFIAIAAGFAAPLESLWRATPEFGNTLLALTLFIAFGICWTRLHATLRTPPSPIS